MSTRRFQLNRLVPFCVCGTAVAPVLAVLEVTGTGSAERHSKVNIRDLAWIAADWVTERDASELQEIWSPPTGDCMMGMFRWLKDGKVWIYELLTIREENATLVLRFRHFAGDLTAWEPETEPLTYRLDSLTAERAVFENPDSESHRRYTFERNGADSLIVRVGAVREGTLHEDEFRYRRK